MNKILTKPGMVLALILMASSMQAHATSYVGLITNEAWYKTYFYVKLPNRGAEYIPADTKDKDGSPANIRLPVNSFVCVGITVVPWTRYINYYFKVTKDGNYSLNFKGTTSNPTYTSLYINKSGDWKEKDTDGGLPDPLIFQDRNVCDQ